jgi:hypothetical protein
LSLARDKGYILEPMNFGFNERNADRINRIKKTASRFEVIFVYSYFDF